MNDRMLIDWLTRMEQKQDKMGETLIVNTAHLAEHMRRTALIEADLKPVKKHVNLVQDAFILASGLGGIALFLHHMNVL